MRRLPFRQRQDLVLWQSERSEYVCSQHKATHSIKTACKETVCVTAAIGLSCSCITVAVAWEKALPAMFLHQIGTLSCKVPRVATNELT